MVRHSRKRSGGNHAEQEIPEASSSDFDVDMLVESDDGDDTRGRALSPKIDESMILSDEEDDSLFNRPSFGDDIEGQANVFVSDEHNAAAMQASAHKPAPKKMWTGRTKKNHSNPVNAATSALMVEDKPWRSKASATKSEASTPKSPSRLLQLVNTSAGNKLPTPPNISHAATNSATPSSIAGPTSTCLLYTSDAADVCSV